jgi:hypothetical protein
MPDIWMDVDAALGEVPVNCLPLIDSGDFVTVEDAVAHNASGMDLRWNFVTCAGAFTSTAVTPTSGGDYDWTHQGDGIYTIEMPASGGASINNDTEGVGWFSGKITGVLSFRGPTIGFRAAGLNDLLIESAFSATRGLAGTALPAAAADAAGGLIVSDAGGLDADAQRSDVAAILADTGTDGVLVSSGTGAKQISLSGGKVLVQGTIDQFDDFVTGAGTVTLAAATHTGAVIPTVSAVTGLTASRLDENVSAAKTLTAGERTSVADALLDRSNAVETGITPRGALRLAVAASAGKLSGAATTTVVIRDVADGKDRVTATVDADGNRTATTVDVT